MKIFFRVGNFRVRVGVWFRRRGLWVLEGLFC